MSLSVFVSHSTNPQAGSPHPVGADDRSFLEDLCSRLGDITDGGEPIFKVNADYKNLRAGDHWRAKLLAGLGVCGAGVVLLNRQAIAHSEWVHTEASIMRWRNWLSECSPLILILYGPGSRDAFGTTAKWKPLAFGEIHLLANGTEFSGPVLPAAAFDELVAALKCADGRCDLGRFGLLREAIETRLKKAAAADQPNLGTSREEADKLIEEGPGGIHDLLDRWGYLLGSGEKRELIEFIAPWWVEPDSSCHLAKLSQPEVEQRDFSVTGKIPVYMAQMYVQHACVQPPDSSWRVATVTAKGGQAAGPEFYASVVEEVRSGLIAAYRAAWDDPQNVEDDEINLLVRINRDAGRPTFVALPNHVAGDGEVRKAVLTAFSGVSLLHVTATAEQARAIAGCQALVPLPQADHVRDAYYAYKGAMSRIAT